jgi:glycosyltransferase involved in cell wall biosynthesis
VTVVMPCLNEADTLATCIRKALTAMSHAGIAGEVVVADNGSTDDSPRSPSGRARGSCRSPIAGTAPR